MATGWVWARCAGIDDGARGVGSRAEYCGGGGGMRAASSALSSSPRARLPVMKISLGWKRVQGLRGTMPAASLRRWDCSPSTMRSCTSTATQKTTCEMSGALIVESIYRELVELCCLVLALEPAGTSVIALPCASNGGWITACDMRIISDARSSRCRKPPMTPICSKSVGVSFSSASSVCTPCSLRIGLRRCKLVSSSSWSSVRISAGSSPGIYLSMARPGGLELASALLEGTQ